MPVAPPPPPTDPPPAGGSPFDDLLDRTAEGVFTWADGNRYQRRVEWRLAEVRQTWADGKFQACVCDHDGYLDESFVEVYSRADEGKEWRRRAADAPGTVLSRGGGGGGRGRGGGRGGRGKKRRRQDKW